MLSLMYDEVGHNFWSIVEFIELQQRSIGLRATDRLIEMAQNTEITGQLFTLTLVIKQNINWCLQQERIISF